MCNHLWHLLWSWCGPNKPYQGPPLSRLKKRTSGYIFNFLGFLWVHIGERTCWSFKHQKSPFPCLQRGMPLLDGEMRCTRTTNITSKQLNLMVWSSLFQVWHFQAASNTQRLKKPSGIHTLDGSEIRDSPVEVGRLSQYLSRFFHPNTGWSDQHVSTKFVAKHHVMPGNSSQIDFPHDAVRGVSRIGGKKPERHRAQPRSPKRMRGWCTWMSQEVIKWFQGGPLLVISGVITPITRVITPATHWFSAIYRGEITPFIIGRVPPCRINSLFHLWCFPTAGGCSDAASIQQPVYAWSFHITHRIHGTGIFTDIWLFFG